MIRLDDFRSDDQEMLEEKIKQNTEAKLTQPGSSLLGLGKGGGK